MTERPVRMLELKDLHAGYGEIRVLKGVNLTANKGEIVALIGANGAGKTTLLRVISGILGKTQGEIVFKGEKIDGLAAHQIVRNGLIHIQEGRRIFRKLSLMENLLMGAYARKNSRVSKSLEAFFELFPALKERQKQLAGTLSGGEQQMLTVGMALMAEPRLLLMDEPSLGLAPMLINDTFRMIKRINESGISILLVEQNARKSLQLAQRGYVLENGNITVEGDSKYLLTNPDVKKAYLGGE